MLYSKDESVKDLYIKISNTKKEAKRTSKDLLNINNDFKMRLNKTDNEINNIKLIDKLIKQIGKGIKKHKKTVKDVDNQKIKEDLEIITFISEYIKLAKKNRRNKKRIIRKAIIRNNGYIIKEK